ncbi:MAG: stage III sporulation protein AB [Clostridia bacterium]|nr:stage III sporulation protein AB [Clostridia bacterium]
MLLKLIGALFVAASSFVLSNHLCSRLTRERDELESFINLISRIRLDISCFSRPLTEIYSGFSSPSLDSIGFTEALRGSGFYGAIRECAFRLSLSDSAKELLASFAEGLGQGYREDEIKRCDHTLSFLDEEYKKCLEALPGKSKLIRSLSVTFGISVIIILI